MGSTNADKEFAAVMAHLVWMALTAFLLSAALANAFLIRVVRFRPRASRAILGVLTASLLWQGWTFADPYVDSIKLGSECSVYDALEHRGGGEGAAVRRGGDRDGSGGVMEGSKVKIIMFFDQDFGLLSEKHNREYARVRGYAFERHMSGCAPLKRALQWTKIALLRLEMDRPNNVDWLVWIDADAVFSNWREGLEESVLSRVGSEAVLVVGSDIEELGRPINTGWMAVRVGAAGKRLLDEIWRTGAKRKKRWLFAHEQDAITHLYRTRADVKSQISIVRDQIRMFSDKDKTLRGDEHVLHAAGWPAHAKPLALRTMIGRTRK